MRSPFLSFFLFSLLALAKGAAAQLSAHRTPFVHVTSLRDAIDEQIADRIIQSVDLGASSRPDELPFGIVEAVREWNGVRPLFVLNNLLGEDLQIERSIGNSFGSEEDLEWGEVIMEGWLSFVPGFDLDASAPCPEQLQPVIDGPGSDDAPCYRPGPIG